MKLSSPDFKPNSKIPAKFTCQGENINPRLQIYDVPANTQSLVLIVDDPDAATDPDGPGKTFDHWIVFNIMPSITDIQENSLPEASVAGNNSANQQHYTGPCPPNGTHRYFFKLYALSTKLELPAGVTKATVENATKNHIIDQAELVGTYQKH